MILELDTIKRKIIRKRRQYSGTKWPFPVRVLQWYWYHAHTTST